MIKIKNKKLYLKIMRDTNKLDDLAIKEYKKNNLKKGKLFEVKSDKLYKKNYYKMFKLEK